MSKPDGIKVKLTEDSEFGGAGEEITLSASVAEQLITAGKAEAVSAQ